MKAISLQEAFYFMTGLVCGLLSFTLISQHYQSLRNERLEVERKYKEMFDQQVTLPDNEEMFSMSKFKYETDLADQLFDEVKILCWVFTHPENHKVKVPHVKRVWGTKCNKLLFVSTQTDPDIPEVIALPVENGRGHLWNKTKLTMKYVYDNYINDYDWFMRADDDK
jgi:hypothetical protein